MVIRTVLYMAHPIGGDVEGNINLLEWAARRDDDQGDGEA